jgi:hypothetical protein
MRYFLHILLLAAIVALSCKRQQPVAQTNTQVQNGNPKPSWVSGKPSSSLYFQGIGVAQKVRGNSDHLENAKKSALNDLASEIEVNVSSNSLLYTLEREYKFQQEFIENITTTTNLNLEGLEIADSWEDDQQYWIFYRLDRNEYYAKKAAEKQQAIDRAADFYFKGKDAWNNQQVKSALDLQLRGLMQLKAYWAESNEFNFDGKTILLDNEIFKEIQNIASSINILATPAKVTLELSNDFKALCNLKVIDKISGKPLDGVSVSYSYRTASGMQKHTIASASGGSINIPIENPDRMASYNELRAKVDLEKLIEIREFDREMISLLRGLETTEIKVPVEFKRPIFYVESNEQNLNGRQLLTYLKDQVSNELIKAGMTITNDKNSAQVVVNIKGRTRQSGTSNGFSISLLNLNISFTDLAGRKIFFESSFNDIKGVGNSFEQAGIKAFEKAKETLNSRYVNDALNTII